MPRNSTPKVKNASHPALENQPAHAHARAPDAPHDEADGTPLPYGSDTPAGRPPAANTRLAYAKDWKHFSAWCRRSGHAALPPAAQTIALYLEACAMGEAGGRALSRTTIERRLCGLAWNAAQRGHPLDRDAPQIAGALAGIRSRPARLPRRREAVDAADILAMLGTLPHDLRGLRDRAILLLGFAAGLRRSQIVGLDLGSRSPLEGDGLVEILPDGLILRLNETGGRREIAVGRGSGENSCPVAAVERWIRFARLSQGPLFRRIGRDGHTVAEARLTDKHVARLVKQTARAAGLDADRAAALSAQSLRTGLVRAATIGRHPPDESGVRSGMMQDGPAQPGRDRFRVNLTKALGL